MSILPKHAIDSMQSLLKSQKHFFTEIGQKFLRFICNHERPQIAKTILNEKNKAGDITRLDFELYYKTMVIQTGWNWHKHRHLDQCNTTEHPEIRLHIQVK